MKARTHQTLSTKAEEIHCENLRLLTIMLECEWSVNTQNPNTTSHTSHLSCSYLFICLFVDLTCWATSWLFVGVIWQTFLCYGLAVLNAERGLAPVSTSCLLPVCFLHWQHLISGKKFSVDITQHPEPSALSLFLLHCYETTFSTPLSSSMSLLSNWPIKTKKGAGLMISTLPGMEEEELIPAFADIPVISELTLKCRHDQYLKSMSFLFIILAELSWHLDVHNTC